MAATWTGWVYAWDTTGPALPGRADWPMRGVDARNTGVYRRTPVSGVSSASPATPRLRIAPNPTRGLAEFRLAGAKDGAQVEILDVIGRRLDSITLQAGSATWKADAGLPPGVYLARVAQGAGILRSRFVLLR